MLLNFTNSEYKTKALNINNQTDKIHNNEDVIMVLISNLSYDALENLCIKLNQNNSKYTKEMWYQFTQGKKNGLNEDEYTNIKKEIMKACFELLEQGIYLGTQMTKDNKFNTSSWISHSLNEAKLSYLLAQMMGYQQEQCDKAFQYGLLHDIGRKFDNSLNHTIKGFEFLTDYNNGEFIDLSPSCLTHSFIDGGRWANNEMPSETDNFKIDEEGNVLFDTKDDITDFLNSYQYNIYDFIVNIADLMATSEKIVSPKERIEDIATRRENIEKADNRAYFYAMLNNTLLKFCQIIGIDNVQEIKITKDMDLDSVKNTFNQTSDYFFKTYENLVNNKKNKSNIHNL